MATVGRGERLALLAYLLLGLANLAWVGLDLTIGNPWIAFLNGPVALMCLHGWWRER